MVTNHLLTGMILQVGGGFKHFFMFIPTWEDDPVWRAYFSDEFFNHQLAKVDRDDFWHSKTETGKKN